MRKLAWPDRLGRWLPGDIERDTYRPSLADAWHAQVSKPRTRVRQMLFAAEVLTMFVVCVRIAATARLQAVAARALHSDLHRHPRREFLTMFFQDVRRALRLFRFEPGFTAAAVLTLALGIGANTALFAVVEAVLLRPLGYSAADELVIVKHRERATGLSKEFIAIGDFMDLRTRQHSLEALVGYGGVQATLFGDGEPVRLRGLSATPELFEMLRVQPAMGRIFGADDVRPGAQPVALISHDLW